MKVELTEEAKRQAREENAWWRKNRDHKRLFTEELRAARKVLKDGPKHQIYAYIDGEPVRLPRSFLPGAVREGAGFTLTIAASPETERALAQSVADRLRALTGKPPSKP